MNEPSIMAGNFAYEEGADLEPDEVAANARLLPLPLGSLPGGGLKHGTIVSVTDQAQDFTCQLVITHKVSLAPHCTHTQIIPTRAIALKRGISNSLDFDIMASVFGARMFVP